MNLLQMSFSAGILVLMIVLVRLLAINRLPKMMFLALWGIVLVRLLIPMSIPSRIGIPDLMNRIAGFLLRTSAMNVSTAPGQPDSYALFYQGPVYAGLTRDPLHLGAILWIWAAGAALLAVFFASSLRKCHREIRTALPVKENVLIDRWLDGQKIRRPLKVLVSDRISTPLTYGILKPRIILPKSMDFGNEPQMRYILTHEFIHIKRFDALWKLVLIAALCVHWFNPMAWILYILANRDLEIACDEKVIRFFGERTKSAYALSLIEMAEHRTKFTPLYSSFSKNATEERIVSIMKTRKTSLFSLVLALTLVVGATAVFAESSENKALHASGVIRTEGGTFIFQDDNGFITVKDSGGKVVSTTTVGGDGKAVLKDGGGKVIKTLQLNDPGNLHVYPERELIRIRSAAISVPKDGQPANGETVLDSYAMPGYTAGVDSKGIVSVKDAGGRVVGTGAADRNGTAVLKDPKGMKIGTAGVKNGNVVRLTVSKTAAAMP